MTLMIFILGELIPKTILALSKADNYALKISPFIRFLVILLYPLTFFNFIVYILLKIVGVNYSNFKKEEISEKREEELRGAIDLHVKIPQEMKNML